MTQNISWLKTDIKEAWAYQGRIYRTESKAMQQYNQALGYAQNSYDQAQKIYDDPSLNDYWEKKTPLERARRLISQEQYLEAVKRNRPKRFKLVWSY